MINNDPTEKEMTIQNEQEKFWEKSYSKKYIEKNSNFNNDLLIKGWKEILKNISAPRNILECGANIGRNIEGLNHIYPDAAKTAIEISADASKILRNKYSDLNVINSSILESKIENDSFDLSFTMGVLIHIHPNDLKQNLEKVILSSKRYVVIGEYFNRTPVSLTYQGEEEKLFKRDFGKFALENFSDQINLLDHGFLWGHLYDEGGFDDITWWVFERK
jgi:pseudaminic acid biosynthesis-associated methylase